MIHMHRPYGGRSQLNHTRVVGIIPPLLALDQFKLCRIFTLVIFLLQTSKRETQDFWIGMNDLDDGVPR